MAEVSKEFTIALAGNPNVGKSTVFNNFTGLHQHTGNWPGKTVESSQGEYIYNNSKYIIQDLPGTYSLTPNSAEEQVTSDYIKSGEYDALVIVLDATCMERNIRFALSIISYVKSKVILCINLIDEAEKKGINIDDKKMSEMLGVPVIKTAARSGKGTENLKKEIEIISNSSQDTEKAELSRKDLTELSDKILDACCTYKSDNTDRRDRQIDKILLSKRFGIPVMLMMLACVFWITIAGANLPSELLNKGFRLLGEKLRIGLSIIHCPDLVISAMIDGVYTALTWIVSVMLPPMAIFFPLFTLMEDSGYLPRIAFNLDTIFRKANAHGKQSLTIAMGFGCNACGVTGCRIIDSPRERLIAIITNSLVPCNGRFPMLIAIISMYFVGASLGAAETLVQSLILLLLIMLSVVVTLICSKILSKTVLKGMESSFILELPPYRRPQIGKVIIRSIFDRTIFVLLRAISAAAPAGLLIWILANIKIGDSTILLQITQMLDPIGRALGLDGAILCAFILGFPANEIVLPIILMIYMSGSTLTEIPDLVQFKEILTANGWTITTAICMLIFALFHFPCSTTCITIWKETHSKKWTLVSILVPLIAGVILCLAVNTVTNIL